MYNLVILVPRIVFFCFFQNIFVKMLVFLQDFYTVHVHGRSNRSVKCRFST
jgi:hypothetical protein